MNGRRLTAAALCLALTGGCSVPDTSAPSGGIPTTTTTTVTSTSARTSVTEKPLPDKSYDPSRDAAADVRTALGQAAADKLPVLLDFGADWCPDCVVLQKLFQADQVAPVLKKYHVVSVDVGRFDRNLALAKKYVKLDKSGIPAVVVLSPDGTIRVATNDGAFANARDMQATEVQAFLTRWAA
ncbi:thioredoxin family protein [Actinocrispum sp. NPDC049592]|uniref:thioredoxin family protein n=1 Tax=Actinocrispum sp. NPDC049592 TaxID=3154835 RepID=UPI0034467B2B